MKKKLAALALTLILLRLMVLAGGAGPLLRCLTEETVPGRDEVPPSAETEPAPSPIPKADADAVPVPGDTEIQPQDADENQTETADRPEVLPTTIKGGLTLRNSTDYTPDLALLLTEGPSQRLPEEGYQILIVHTHGSEAYTPDGEDQYEVSDNYRTEDKAYSVIRVGDELAAQWEAAGLRVLHDRNIYDYPSYTGSYTRSGEAVSACLAEHPEIAVVIDLHRDALGSGDTIYKTVAAVDGAASSQLMLLVGTDSSGLEHPAWQENLKLALGLQAAVNIRYPTLARPVSLVRERYNQHLTTGSLILEVGSSGNTLQEALTAIRLFADATAPVLSALVGR